MRNLILTVVNLAAYAVAAMALFVLSPVADLSLPWWVALAAPAVVYTLLVKMCCPRANTAEAIGIVALLSWPMPPSPRPPGWSTRRSPRCPIRPPSRWPRGSICPRRCSSSCACRCSSCRSGRSMRRRARGGGGRLRGRGASAVGADGSARASGLHRICRPARCQRPARRRAGGGPPSLAGPGPDGLRGRAGRSRGDTAPIAGGSRRDGAERVEEVVSIPFSRIAAQLPAGAFTIPPDRLGANLLEPGHLLVPTRLRGAAAGRRVRDGGVGRSGRSVPAPCARRERGDRA